MTPRRTASKCERSEQPAIAFTIAEGTPQFATAVVTGSNPMMRRRKTIASEMTNPTTLERERVEAKTPTADAAPARRKDPT